MEVADERAFRVPYLRVVDVAKGWIALYQILVKAFRSSNSREVRVVKENWQLGHEL
jgi:hypothetical protein